MIIIFFLLTQISEQKNQSCRTILNEGCCEENDCKWENQNCKIKQNNYYCNSYNNPLQQELCIQDTSCAFYNNKCEHFFGCGAYQNFGANCPRISINCISVTDEIVCMQKPFNCLQISEMKYCGRIDHQQGSKESCEWKDERCQFVGCEKTNEFSQLSQSKCQSFHKVCKFDGIECKIQLLECSSYKQNCNQIIAQTGRCQFNTINQICMNASCYNYFEDSQEKCQKHYGQLGSQCVYNKDKFEGLCLEFDYQTQVGKCMMEMKNKSCDQFLQISQCFGIATQKYDSKIKFCLDDQINLERRDCKTISDQYECNLIETIELKKCQWIKNSCQTINQCSDYVLRLDSTEEDCNNLNLNCKQISCSNNKYGCCISIQGCSGYLLEEECTNNSNIILNLFDACIWENKSCRYKQCEDYSNDVYQCNNLAECIFIGKTCQTRSKVSCEGLEQEDCRFKNCFWVSQKCYDVSNLTTYLPQLAKELEDLDTVCQSFSDKLMYSSSTRTCRLKTACQNYSSFCQGMKQYDDAQCVNENSQCIPMTFCSQLQSSDYKICYKALNSCNSDGSQWCEIAEQQCSAYKEQKKCNFQLDGSLCNWISVLKEQFCIVKQCENLNLQECDSKYLCMEPKLCRQNMCIEYQNQCFTIKSRCSDYRENQCYKSISNLCFWNRTQCMNLMSCNMLTQNQCKDQKYINTCKFNQYSSQCEELDCSNTNTYYISLDLRNVVCQNTTNSCSQNNNQGGYSNFCSYKEV